MQKAVRLPKEVKMELCRKIGESYHLITYADCKSCDQEGCPIHGILQELKAIRLVQASRGKKKKYWFK